jgi:hypothetical protein
MSYVVVDEMRKVVLAVSETLTPKLKLVDSGITAVHYEHGHPIEIIETLREKDASESFKFDKYPLIALFQDFPEDVNVGPGVQSEVTLHLIIARATMPSYKAADRYNFNMRPVLYPIYEELLKQLYYSRAFMIKSPGQIPHKKYDRLYWGREGLQATKSRNEKNIFNDWIDCIEIKNLKIKVNQKLC